MADPYPPRAACKSVSLRELLRDGNDRGCPGDRRCVFFGWLIVIILAIVVLAIIGAISLVRGVGRRV
jgi:hypothetical protein